MTDTLPLREQIARIIDGGAWQRHGFTGDPDWHPDDQRLEQRRSLAKADAIMALLPSLPDGWVGPTYEDACRLSRAFNQSANLRDDQDRRINEWITTLIQQSQHATPTAAGD